MTCVKSRYAYFASESQPESVINDALATLFRERAGPVASSETLQVGTYPGIIVRTPDSLIIVEVELEPACMLEANALSRLGTKIDGRKIQVAFTVSIPEASVVYV